MRIYHGSKKIVSMPISDHKSGHGDFGNGFYATQSDELAREWAAASVSGGFLNIYELDTEDLTEVDLSGQGYRIKDWISFILLSRPGLLASLQSGYNTEDHSRIREITEKADIIKGYRADDSSLSYLREHLAGHITEQDLLNRIIENSTGEQVVIKSRKALSHLTFLNAEIVNGSIYRPRRLLRDYNARSRYEKTDDPSSSQSGAYPYLYMNDARRCLGEFTSYVSQAIEGTSCDNALNIFMISSLAEPFENGDPRVVCGLSGIELYHMVTKEAGLARDYSPYEGYIQDEDSSAYRAGALLAYCQWMTGLSFSEILSSISFDRLQALCEENEGMNSEEAAVIIRRRMAARRPYSSNLQAARKRLSLSQKELAALSGVNLRTLQQYETGDKDINRAAAETVEALARTLFCPAGRIMER